MGYILNSSNCIICSCLLFLSPTLCFLVDWCSCVGVVAHPRACNANPSIRTPAGQIHRFACIAFGWWWKLFVSIWIIEPKSRHVRFFGQILSFECLLHVEFPISVLGVIRECCEINVLRLVCRIVVWLPPKCSQVSNSLCSYLWFSTRLVEDRAHFAQNDYFLTSFSSSPGCCHFVIICVFSFGRIVATPGRLMHIVKESDLGLNAVKHFICDEADRYTTEPCWYEIGCSQSWITQNKCLWTLQFSGFYASLPPPTHTPLTNHKKI